MYSRNRLTAGLAAVTVAFALGACDDSSPSSPSDPSSVSSPATVEPQFANNSQQNGLVNVSTGDIDVLNNVNLAVAANVIATVCGVDVVAAVLAEQVFADGSQTFCEGTAEEVTITQATPGENPGPAGGNNSQQEGLINVSLGDVAILNDVNVAVAANVIATVCDVDIAAAVLAAQAVGDVSETACTSTAGPLELVQS
jgi:hypothetical protein